MGSHSFVLSFIGGIGVIGGLRQSPKILQESIEEIKSHLEDPSAPFGVDLLIPQVGGQARKTNVSSSVHRWPLLLNVSLSMTTRRANFRSLPTSSLKVVQSCLYVPWACLPKRWWTSSMPQALLS